MQTIIINNKGTCSGLAARDQISSACCRAIVTVFRCLEKPPLSERAQQFELMQGLDGSYRLEKFMEASVISASKYRL